MRRLLQAQGKSCSARSQQNGEPGSRRCRCGVTRRSPAGQEGRGKVLGSAWSGRGGRRAARLSPPEELRQPGTSWHTSSRAGAALGPCGEPQCSARADLPQRHLPPRASASAVRSRFFRAFCVLFKRHLSCFLFRKRTFLYSWITELRVAQNKRGFVEQTHRYFLKLSSFPLELPPFHEDYAAWLCMEQYQLENRVD